MKQQLVLSTPRLLLRTFEIEDAERVNELAGDYEVAKSTLNIPHPYSVEIAQEWIKSHEAAWDEGRRLVYAIIVNDNSSLIGTVSLMDICKLEASLGYWVGREYWGQGYCTEAVAALLKHSLETLHLNRILAEHLTSNPASGRVMQKNNMQYIGKKKALDRFQNESLIEMYEIFNE